MALFGCHQESVCSRDEKTQDIVCLSNEQLWGPYTYDELFSQSSALLSLDASRACDGITKTSMNDVPSRYQKCAEAYASLQQDLPSFSPDAVEVYAGVSSLEVYASSEYYTGSAPFIRFQEGDLYLSSTAYIIEEGCENPFYYSNFLCYYLSGEEPGYSSEGLQLTCNNYMRAIVLQQYPICTDSWTELSLGLETKGNSLYEPKVPNDDLMKLYFDSAQELEVLVERLGG